MHTKNEFHFDTRIKTILAACKAHPQRILPVKPCHAGPWRGAYDSPCVFVRVKPGVMGDFIPYIEALLTQASPGFNGGEYRFTPDMGLRVEYNPSDCSGDSSLWEVLLWSETNAVMLPLTHWFLPCDLAV